MYLILQTHLSHFCTSLLAIVHFWAYSLYALRFLREMCELMEPLLTIPKDFLPWHLIYTQISCYKLWAAEEGPWHGKGHWASEIISFPLFTNFCDEVMVLWCLNLFSGLFPRKKKVEKHQKFLACSWVFHNNFSLRVPALIVHFTMLEIQSRCHLRHNPEFEDTSSNNTLASYTITQQWGLPWPTCTIYSPWMSSPYFLGRQKFVHHNTLCLSNTIFNFVFESNKLTEELQWYVHKKNIRTHLPRSTYYWLVTPFAPAYGPLGGILFKKDQDQGPQLIRQIFQQTCQVVNIKLQPYITSQSQGSGKVIQKSSGK